MSKNEEVSWSMFENACQMVAKYFGKYPKDKKVISIYGIPRGGLVVAVRLSHLLNIPIIMSPNKIEPSTLVVDDICDTGRTLKPFISDIFTKTAVLYRQINCPIYPTYWIYPKRNKWVTFPWEKS